MEKRKVSVVIPMYNVENYLEQCLQSVINQTFQELEIICIDDGSTDKTLLVANLMSEKDDRILVMKNSQNRGPSYTRNKGMSIATGKYLYFLDSDDMIEENAIAELWDKAEKNNLEVIFFDGKIIFDDNGLTEKFNGYNLQHFGEYKSVMSGEEAFNIMQQNGEWTVNAPRQFWRIDFLRNNGIKFEDGILHEDELFSTLAILKVKRCSVEKKQYFIRRLREKSIMTSVKSQKNLEGCFKCLCRIIEYLECYAEETSGYTEINCYLNKIKNHVVTSLLDHNDWEIYPRNSLEYTVKKMIELQIYQIFSKQDIYQLRSSNRIIIYGAGKAAIQVWGELFRLNIFVDGFAVTRKQGNADSLLGLPVQEISNCKEIEETIFIIAIKNRKDSKEIKSILYKMGAEQVIVPYF